jgi:hypothetical protein
VHKWVTKREKGERREIKGSILSHANATPGAGQCQQQADCSLSSASGRSTPDTLDIWSKIWSDLEYVIGVL